MKNLLNTKNLKKYSRQIILKSIGPQGQKKILTSNVLLIGAGGLGCPIADYLSRAGVGKIGIVDDDKVDISNLHRQSMYNHSDINKFKVDILKKRIVKINPDIKLKTYKTKIIKSNIQKIVKQYDIIVDGSDNFETKFLLNQYSLINKKKLIIGAIGKFDGHIFSFDFKRKNTPCLKCFYQSIPADKTLNCETEGVIGPIAGLVGSLQAFEVMRNILDIGSSLAGKILILNLLSYNFRTAKFTKKNKCICKKY